MKDISYGDGVKRGLWGGGTCSEVVSRGFFEVGIFESSFEE